MAELYGNSMLGKSRRGRKCVSGYFRKQELPVNRLADQRAPLSRPAHTSGALKGYRGLQPPHQVGEAPLIVAIVASPEDSLIPGFPDDDSLPAAVQYKKYTRVRARSRAIQLQTDTIRARHKSARDLPPPFEPRGAGFGVLQQAPDDVFIRYSHLYRITCAGATGLISWTTGLDI